MIKLNCVFLVRDQYTSRKTGNTYYSAYFAIDERKVKLSLVDGALSAKLAEMRAGTEVELGIEILPGYQDRVDVKVVSVSEV